MESKKICLAYSGGLDTSIILAWLLDQGYQVVAFMADVGQQDDFAAAEKKAYAIGATKFIRADCREQLATQIVVPALQANAVYQDVYLLGTALARPVIAAAQIAAANAENCQYVAHGCTGKGNDQVRFELAFYALQPDIKVLAPWREPEFFQRFRGRSDLLAYAAEKNIPVAQTQAKPWSTDENMAHISYEAGILEDPATQPPKDMWKTIVSPQDAPDVAQHLALTFAKGVPVLLEYDGKKVEGVLDIFGAVGDLARANGVGRIDIVEDRYVNLKSRGCYEQAPMTVLRAAHVDLEGLTLDREVRMLRDQFVTPSFSKLMYNGGWYSPEGEYIRKMVPLSQDKVNGTVEIDLYKGNVIITGRTSSEKLYDATESSMDELTGFSPQDATGFIAMQAMRIKKYRL